MLLGVILGRNNMLILVYNMLSGCDIMLRYYSDIRI